MCLRYGIWSRDHNAIYTCINTLVYPDPLTKGGSIVVVPCSNMVQLL